MDDTTKPLDLFDIDRRANGGETHANAARETGANPSEFLRYIEARRENERLNRLRIEKLSAARCRPAAGRSESRATTPNGAALAVSDDAREEVSDAGASDREEVAGSRIGRPDGGGRPPGLTTVARGISRAVVLELVG